MINKNTVLNFFFPQKCPVCRTIIKLGEEGSVMCPVCRLKWGYEKEKLCTECSLPAYLCTCMPKRMSTAGALDLLKLCFYDSNSGSAGLEFSFDEATVFISDGFLGSGQGIFNQLDVLLRHELAHNLMMHQIRLMYVFKKLHASDPDNPTSTVDIVRAYTMF